MAGDGGQFALAVKNWQEPFVHKWDTSLKVSNTGVINACTPLFLMYLLPTESTVAALNLFSPGAFPEYRLDCRQLSNRWHCSPVKQQCDSFVELGVVCINYEEFYKRSRNRTLSTQLPLSPIECIPGNERGTTRADNSTTFIGIGVLVSLLLAVSVGWIVSCVIVFRRGQTVHKQQ